MDKYYNIASMFCKFVGTGLLRFADCVRTLRTLQLFSRRAAVVAKLVHFLDDVLPVFRAPVVGLKFITELVQNYRELLHEACCVDGKRFGIEKWHLALVPSY